MSAAMYCVGCVGYETFEMSSEMCSEMSEPSLELRGAQYLCRDLSAREPTNEHVTFIPDAILRLFCSSSGRDAHVPTYGGLSGSCNLCLRPWIIFVLLD